MFVTRTTADGLGSNICNAIDVDGSLVVAATNGANFSAISGTETDVALAVGRHNGYRVRGG